MRISSNTVSDGIVRQIQQLSSQQARLQNQVATGLRISQPEDDPAAVGRVLNLESERRQLEQYGSNANRALQIAQASFSGLDNLKKISDRAGELGTLGTGTLGPDALKAYGTEVDQLIEQTLQVANTRFNGDYIYGGTAVDAPPFTAARDANGKVTTVSYDGNAAQTAIPLSEATSISPGTTGATNSGVADFLNHLVALRDALNSGDPAAVTTAQPGLAQSEDTLIGAIADNGGVQTRIQASLSQQTDRKTSLDSLVSSETDADLPSTIVKLNQTQTAYQAALQSATNIMRLSLLDYLK
ncbi:MAG TPA: flagellar hook-associated protein FlgL [Opitutaceae bacterium]|nr:flagellar hook-associated protein FlgL [Opitutaceae bacterium]